MRHSIGSVPDVGHHDGGIGRRLNQHDRKIFRGTDGFFHLAGVSGLDGNAANTKRAEKILNQVLRAAINGDGVNYILAGTGEGEQGGHDGRHPRIENQCRVRAGFKRYHARFQNFGVGVVEARIDQIGLLAGCRLSTSSHQVEGALGGFGAGENVGGTAKHRGTRRSDGKRGVETARKDLRWRAEVLLIGHVLPPTSV